uniref:VWFA domain-containing protein n=1 Tax=Sander lucioperca TaxID=283035 RepID=A0A8C9XF38_SANLU
MYLVLQRGQFVLFLCFSLVMEITTVQTQKVVRDIVFLVDGSNYVGSSNFPYVRAFILNVVNQLDVRPDRVRIGLLQFAESQNIEFHLNSYSSRQDVVNKISQLRLTGGSVLNTGAAMNYALANMFQPSTGSRRKQGVQQVLVLITGGPVQDQAKNAADKLALAGVLTFTVSSGVSSTSCQLVQMEFKWAWPSSAISLDLRWISTPMDPGRN